MTNSQNQVIFERNLFELACKPCFSSQLHTLDLSANTVTNKNRWFVNQKFKAGVCYFLINFYLSPNDSPSKTVKNILYLI